MENSNIHGIFKNAWEAELNQAEEELRQMERERAIEDIARLINRFNITAGDIENFIGPEWSKSAINKMTPFEPYFGHR